MAKGERDLAKERGWRDLVKRQAASGLSVRAFCQREGLSQASFYGWRRTIGQRDGTQRTQSPSIQSPSILSPSTQSPAFVPIVVTGGPRRETGFVIELIGGRVLRLPEAIATQRLAELVLTLEAADSPWSARTPR